MFLGQLTGSRSTLWWTQAPKKNVVSKKVFDKIYQDDQPKLVKRGKLMHAGVSQAMTVYGRCKVNIVLDQVKLHNEVVIADLNDEVLLGMDIPKGMDGKPADIILSQNKIILNGQEINCQSYPQICNRGVRAAENYQIQGHTEQIIDTFVERYECDDGLLNSDFIVEPSQNFKENLPLVMAPCLVDINYAPPVKVIIMNPFPTNASIKAETIIGTAEILINPPQNFQACENENEEGNSSSARRLQFSHPSSGQFTRQCKYSEGQKFRSH